MEMQHVAESEGFYVDSLIGGAGICGFKDSWVYTPDGGLSGGCYLSCMFFVFVFFLTEAALLRCNI